MDAHHVNCGIVTVILDVDRFDVQEPAANIHAKVVMNPLFVPLGPRLREPVDFATSRKKT
jgi:hypothetical protein